MFFATRPAIHLVYGALTQSLALLFWSYTTGKRTNSTGTETILVGETSLAEVMTTTLAKNNSEE